MSFMSPTKGKAGILPEQSLFFCMFTGKYKLVSDMCTRKTHMVLSGMPVGHKLVFACSCLAHEGMSWQTLWPFSWW